MKKYNIMTFMLALTILVTLASCGGTTNLPDPGAVSNVLDSANSSEQNYSDSSIDAITQTITEISAIELNHTYTTRFEEVNFINYPAFCFDYPDGWTIKSEEVTDFSERVILINSSGITVTYWHFGEMRDLTGPYYAKKSVDVTKVTDSSFVPGYVQATDYSDLGTFMVAKLTTTSEYDESKGGAYTEFENGPVRYAVLPESQSGKQEERIIDGLPTFSFWYADHISVIADSPNGKFTEQEEKEVIAILSSFREKSIEIDPPNIFPESTDSNTVTTIDELWTKLKGTWSFEAYEFKGKAEHNQDYTMELHYIDKKPCMSRYSQETDGHYPDIFFYEFSALDASHYIAYTYEKGSYGGEWENWGDDVLSAWYSFDLSNLSNGELLIGYHIAFDNGFVDNNHLYKYSLA